MAMQSSPTVNLHPMICTSSQDSGSRASVFGLIFGAETETSKKEMWSVKKGCNCQEAELQALIPCTVMFLQRLKNRSLGRAMGSCLKAVQKSLFWAFPSTVPGPMMVMSSA